MALRMTWAGRASVSQAKFIQSPGNRIGHNPICSECGAAAEYVEVDGEPELTCTGCGGIKDEGIVVPS